MVILSNKNISINKTLHKRVSSIRIWKPRSLIVIVYIFLATKMGQKWGKKGGSFLRVKGSLPEKSLYDGCPELLIFSVHRT